MDVDEFKEEMRLEQNTRMLARFASLSLIIGGAAIILLTEYVIPGLAIAVGGWVLAAVGKIWIPCRF